MDDEGNSGFDSENSSFEEVRTRGWERVGERLKNGVFFKKGRKWIDQNH